MLPYLDVAILSSYGNLLTVDMIDSDRLDSLGQIVADSQSVHLHQSVVVMDGSGLCQWQSKSK